jgi:hypothetical protein
MSINKPLRWTPAVMAVAFAVALPASAAGASSPSPSPVTIQLQFTTGQTGTFTASGPVCPAGTLSVPQVGQGLTKVLTCDDGSGSFAIHLNGKAAAGSSVPQSWLVSRSYASGAYLGLKGSGVLTGGTCLDQLAPCDADLAGEVEFV